MSALGLRWAGGSARWSADTPFGVALFVERRTVGDEANRRDVYRFRFGNAYDYGRDHDTTIEAQRDAERWLADRARKLLRTLNKE